MTTAPAGQSKAAEENPFQETAQKQAEKTPAQKRAETIAAKKAEEAEATDPVKDEATDPVKDEADKGTPEKEKKEKVVEDEVLHTADFDQYPFSATHGDVVGTVALNGAVPVLKLALVGWIGEEPMAIRAEDARDLEKVLKDLRKQVKK